MGVTSISAGGTHTLALLSDGTVAAWGENTDGEPRRAAGIRHAHLVHSVVAQCWRIHAPCCCLREQANWVTAMETGTWAGFSRKNRPRRCEC